MIKHILCVCVGVRELDADHETNNNNNMFILYEAPSSHSRSLYRFMRAHTEQDRQIIYDLFMRVFVSVLRRLCGIESDHHLQQRHRHCGGSLAGGAPSVPGTTVL